MMYKWIFIIWMLALTACTNKSSENAVATDSDTIIPVQFTDTELLAFLDSIHELSAEPWIKTASTLPDSVYNNVLNLNVSIHTSDFELLKRQVSRSKLSVDLFRKLVPNAAQLLPDSIKTPINAILHSFSATTFNFFAVELFPDTWESTVLFFNKNKLLAVHRIFHKYGLEMNYFEGENQLPTVYYRQNFESGTGIWWWNYNFFAFTEQKLVPVLNELQNANYQFPWGLRAFWFETTVVETKPLTLKMVYDAQLWNLENDAEPWHLFSDSCKLTYYWNNKLLRYEPDFSNSTLNRTKITSFYLTGSEELFINAYYTELKALLSGADTLKQRAIFKYLNEVKNGRQTAEIEF